MKRDGPRAFLFGASPDAEAAHARKCLRALGADPESDSFIAVDGGIRLLRKIGRKMALKPNLWVGDGDSGSAKGGRGGDGKPVPRLILPRAKDRSDLFFAALAAISAGATRIHAFGVTGGRPDHHLASLLDLADLAMGQHGKLDAVAAHGPEAEYRFVSRQTGPWEGRKETWARKTRTGSTVSIFALHGAAEGVTLRGFRYPLSSARLEPGSHGLSNQAIRPSTARVSVRRGVLVIVFPALTGRSH